jgi:hypothetical protein
MLEDVAAHNARVLALLGADLGVADLAVAEEEEDYPELPAGGEEGEKKGKLRAGPDGKPSQEDMIKIIEAKAAKMAADKAAAAAGGEAAAAKDEL